MTNFEKFRKSDEVQDIARHLFETGWKIGAVNNYIKYLFSIAKGGDDETDNKVTV